MDKLKLAALLLGNSKLVESGCREWQRQVNEKGYGKVTRKTYGEVKAHRAAYRVFKGEIPEGYVVMHSCDNPRCINPEHLSVGTLKDNTQDMMRKGRHKYIIPKTRYGKVRRPKGETNVDFRYRSQRAS